MQTYEFLSDLFLNDKVLIPALVCIIMYCVYNFPADMGRDIALTGLGYLAGATQGKASR
jgi:hypothetical protein